MPVEAITHEEDNGTLIECKITRDVQAVDGASGRAIRYFVLTPMSWQQLEPNGLQGLFALVMDHGTFHADPVGEVDGEDLQGDVALYMRQHFDGFRPEGLAFWGWIELAPLG